MSLQGLSPSPREQYEWLDAARRRGFLGHILSLMFNRVAKIPGTFRHLESSGPTALFMRFDTVSDVNAKAAELEKIMVAWCDLMA